MKRLFDDIPGDDPIYQKQISASLSEQLDRYMEEAKVRLANKVKVYSSSEYSQEFLRSLIPN